MSKLMPLLIMLGACQLHAGKPTNFIQILTDDQGWGDLHSYGRLELKTPHIDQLAADGIKLTDCYSSAGVCSPSRAACPRAEAAAARTTTRWRWHRPPRSQSSERWSPAE